MDSRGHVARDAAVSQGGKASDRATDKSAHRGEGRSPSQALAEKHHSSDSRPRMTPSAGPWDAATKCKTELIDEALEHRRTVAGREFVAALRTAGPAERTFTSGPLLEAFDLEIEGNWARHEMTPAAFSFARRLLA